MLEKITKLFLVVILVTVTATATEIEPPKKVVNGDTCFIVSKKWQLLYYKINKKKVFKVLSYIRGQTRNKKYTMASGKIISQKCSLEDGLFSMQRKISLKGDEIEADLKIDIAKNGKVNFNLKLDYKGDVSWTSNLKRMNNMLVMQTAVPVKFRAINVNNEELQGTTEGKVNYNYLREVNVETAAGTFVIKAENEATSIRFASPKQMGAKFNGAYIMVGLFNTKEKSRLVSFEQGDSEELKFSISPVTAQKKEVKE